MLLCCKTQHGQCSFGAGVAGPGLSAALWVMVAVGREQSLPMLHAGHQGHGSNSYSRSSSLRVLPLLDLPSSHQDLVGSRSLHNTGSLPRGSGSSGSLTPALSSCQVMLSAGEDMGLDAETVA